jgi:hypothetical protein
MKKKLEADLISIAHRVLQMKNKSDVNQLYIETQNLYEKLSVLRFVEENFGDIKPTIGQAEIVEKMSGVFEETNLTDFNTSVVIEIEKIEKIEGVEESEEILEEEYANVDFEEEELEESITLGFQPAFELDVEFEDESQKKAETVQISFDDLLGENYNETLFVKANPREDELSTIGIDLSNEIELEDEEEISLEINLTDETTPSKATSLNESLAKGIKIDLNDRIAFVKHLFGNSEEDYSRVLNQLITYDSFEEAESFIEDMVKPDYNGWEGKEDYSQRFIEIIEKKFD